MHWRQAHSEQNIRLYRKRPIDIMDRLRKVETDMKLHEMKIYLYAEIEQNGARPCHSYFDIRTDIKSFIRNNIV